MVSKIKSNYKTSKLAEEDLLAIFLHGIESYGVKKAQQYSAEIDKTFNLLADYPGMGKNSSKILLLEQAWDDVSQSVY